ncbi:MAG TPA: transcriptional regulator BetI [Thermohalobaculum sp.]|nr:transcriptional regulator BetI [Thermohalobaculum sp.]
MPRIGMEPIRRKALIEAAIETIGAQGSLDVTMSQIARSAGVSPALAHHYFGGKEQLFLATMRHLLTEFGANIRAALGDARSPRARISAIIGQSFRPEQFDAANVSAWLSFYMLAQSDPQARRLLAIYARRLSSNLVEALICLAPRAEALRIAEGIAALIDGLYIRRALKDGPPDPASAIALVEDFVDTRLAATRVLATERPA